MTIDIEFYFLLASIFGRIRDRTERVCSPKSPSKSIDGDGFRISLLNSGFLHSNSSQLREFHEMDLCLHALPVDHV